LKISLHSNHPLFVLSYFYGSQDGLSRTNNRSSATRLFKISPPGGRQPEPLWADLLSASPPSVCRVHLSMSAGGSAPRRLWAQNDRPLGFSLNKNRG
jgi:hypothetical protein